MDRHKESLRQICRLCKAPNAVYPNRQPTLKTAFSSIILKGFQVDVTNEDACIYPPYICQGCTRKLKRWHDKKRRRVVKNKLNIEPAEFEEHTTNCCICSMMQEPDENSVVHTVGGTGKNSLINSVSFLAKQYSYLTMYEDNSVICLKTSQEGRLITERIQIYEDGSWKIEVHGRQVTSGAVISAMPAKLTSQLCPTLFQMIAKASICPGNLGFDLICRDKTKSPLQPAVFFNNQGGIESYEENCITHTSIRHSKCELLTTSRRCSVCYLYRSNLSIMKSRLENRSSVDTTKIRNDRLSRKELEEKARNLQREKINLKRKVKTLEDSMREVIERKGEVLEDDLSASLSMVMEENEAHIKSTLGKNSPQYIFWQQQREAVSKLKTQRRWHPSVIKWCIALHSKSPSAYKMIRGSKVLVLPHESTLRDYTQFTTVSHGLSQPIIKRIQKDISFDTLPEFKKNVSLVFDEMKIKSGLVYLKSTGKLMGFVDLGDVNQEIQQYTENLQKTSEDNDETRNDDKHPLATHVLALMVRGIFSPLKEVFAWYPCNGFNSHQLYNTVWDGIGTLEYAGFCVRALVSDGASPNRRFYRLHKQGEDGDETPTYYVENPFADRKIYFMCDMPHLMKTTRNNWENSGWNNKTRNLHYQHQSIQWTQLVNLVEDDMGINGRDGIAGLRHLPKITNEHVYLNPSLRMKVKLATQVLSSSVAHAFAAKGRHDTKSTEKFVSMMDKCFDCLNVSNRFQGRRSRKPEQEPYRRPDDWRFQWLKGDFLGFLNDWETECMSTPNLTMTEKRKMCLSRETLEGFRITVNSFVSLVPELLELEGVDYLLSEKFCQDPLEEYFSKQRGSLGRNEAPTVAEFSRNALSIFVAGSAAVQASKHGNCDNAHRREDEERYSHDEHLPRRNRRSS